MSRSKRDLSDPYVQITPNQIVAYNLAEARALRGSGTGRRRARGVRRFPMVQGDLLRS